MKEADKAQLEFAAVIRRELMSSAIHAATYYMPWWLDTRRAPANRNGWRIA